MLGLALLAVTAIFILLFGVRFGAARRGALMERWPALAFAGAAIFAGMRGAIWPALALGAFAVLSWVFWPGLQRRLRRCDAAAADSARAEDPAEKAARQLLGVGAGASDSDIRRAYRTKMARAHPDKGGSHNEAARLTAARDRLLKGRKG